MLTARSFLVCRLVAMLNWTLSPTIMVACVITSPEPNGKLFRTSSTVVSTRPCGSFFPTCPKQKRTLPFLNQSSRQLVLLKANVLSSCKWQWFIHQILHSYHFIIPYLHAHKLDIAVPSPWCMRQTSVSSTVLNSTSIWCSFQHWQTTFMTLSVVCYFSLGLVILVFLKSLLTSFSHKHFTTFTKKHIKGKTLQVIRDCVYTRSCLITVKVFFFF